MKNPIIRPVHTPFCPILLVPARCRRQLAAACRSRLRDGSGDPARGHVSVFRGERPTAPAVPHRAARRRGANARPPPRRPAVDASGRTSIVLLALRARYAVRWSLGTREAHRPPAAARRHRRVGGTARGASSFTASRSSRFARFDIVSFRSRRVARRGTAGQRARAWSAGRHARRIRDAKRKGRSVRVSGLKNAYKSR